MNICFVWKLARVWWQYGLRNYETLFSCFCVSSQVKKSLPPLSPASTFRKHRQHVWTGLNLRKWQHWLHTLRKLQGPYMELPKAAEVLRVWASDLYCSNPTRFKASFQFQKKVYFKAFTLLPIIITFMHLPYNSNNFRKKVLKFSTLTFLLRIKNYFGKSKRSKDLWIQGNAK